MENRDRINIILNKVNFSEEEKKLFLKSVQLTKDELIYGNVSASNEILEMIKEMVNNEISTSEVS